MFLIKSTKSVRAEKISFTDSNLLKNLCGEHDKHLKFLEKLEPVKIKPWGKSLSVTGEDAAVAIASGVIRQLYEMMQKGWHVHLSDFDYAHRILSDDIDFDLSRIFLDTVFISSKKRIIAPKSIAQRHYIDAMRNADMVLAIGPAGTGKTYLAMAMAVSSLLEKKVQRIILTRPAVEAGERLGFLPGDLAEKVNPYLRPLYDALYDMVEAAAVLRKIQAVRIVHFSQVDVVRHPLVADVISAYASWENENKTRKN